MPTSNGLRAFVTADSRGQHYILSDEVTQDAMQISGRWLKTDDPVELER